MGFFSKSKPKAEPTVVPVASDDFRIMKAMWELSRENNGGFVLAAYICNRAGVDALTVGYTRIVEDLEARGLVEHDYESPIGGDRPTEAGLMEYGLIPATRVNPPGSTR